MKTVQTLVAAVAVLFALTGTPVEPAQKMRIRGTITAVDGPLLQVTSREGTQLKIDTTGHTRISMLTALKLADIKQGSFVGVTAIQHGPGTPLQAREVHVFAEAQRGTGEGHYPWDLEPGASMTNANVDAIVDTNDGKELTLSYKGGSQKISVTEGTPVVAFTPGDRSLLKPGAQIFCIAVPEADGHLTAEHISVGADGMRPPM